jgi:hypothetical protein
VTASLGPTPDQDGTLTILTAELDRLQVDQATRSTGLDTKAGLLLATAGIFISLRADAPTWWTVASVLVATVSAAMSIAVFWPRMGSDISPRMVRQGATEMSSASEVGWNLWSARLKVYEGDKEILKSKRWRLLWAGILIVAAAVISLMSMMFSVGDADSNQDPQPGPQGSSTPSGLPSSTT